MQVAKRLTNQISDNRELRDTLKLRDNKIKEQEDKIHALQTQLAIEESKVKKWETMQDNGYTALVINDNVIVSGVNVLPYSTFTYTQELPKELNTMKYRKSPFKFCKLDSNGKIVFDTQKYKKYASI